MSSSPSPLPALAFTVACGPEARAEARRCEASFRHWHPEIPFLCIDDAGYPLLSGGHPPAGVGEIVSLRSLAGWFLSQHARRLIYLDADVFVLGRLEGLLDEANPTAWTSDWTAFTLGVPEAPRINTGVLASSDPAFWQAWTAAQYGYLVPALDRVFIDQLTIRLLVLAGAVQGRMLDGRPGVPYYNVSIGEQPGTWRVEDKAVYLGAERLLIFHPAGRDEKGIAAAPAEMRPLLEEITRDLTPGAPSPDLAAWWEADGVRFTAMIREQFPQWPIATFENVVPEAYAATPGFYRTVAPLAYDRARKMEGSGWERIWKREWQGYLYLRSR